MYVYINVFASAPILSGQLRNPDSLLSGKEPQVPTD
jgi:hypothetical protein